MKRISMWSGPRNVSTAIMYSFAQRPDTTVVDEPLYGYYLSHRGVEHPGSEHLTYDLETDANSIIDEILNGTASDEVIFYKNMAHHLIDLDMNFLSKLTNLILVRDPKEVIVSLSKTIGEVDLIDTGFEFQWMLYEKFRNETGNVIVIDSKDLLDNPSTFLKILCQKLDIPFYESMLKWNKGGIPQDGPWAKYWYENVHNSEGFQPYKKNDRTLPADKEILYRKCLKYYDLLTENKLTV